MHFGRRRAAVLLSILPLLSTALALSTEDIRDTAKSVQQDIKDTAKSVQNAANKAIPKVDDVAEVATSVLSSPTRIAIGTKDAPVDGLDGKPHTGPFLDSASSSDKSAVKDSSNTRPKIKKPEGEDGVMNDANRQTPKKGTTGTEGGVSEKERLAEAGGVKKPEAPKEAPELPASDSARLGLKTTDDTKKALSNDDSASQAEKPRGAAGIEV